MSRGEKIGALLVLAAGSWACFAALAALTLQGLP